MTLTINSPVFRDVKTEDPHDAFVELVRALRRFQIEVVNNVQQLDAEANMKYYEQATEPTVASDGNAVFWKDTDDSKVYLVFRNSDGQKKVELT